MKKRYDHKHSIYAVDLDGTLAEEMHPYDPKYIGPPVIDRIDIVKRWLKQGKKIVIFTSRMHSSHTPAELQATKKLVTAWCVHYLGKRLPITAEKSPLFEKIFDNRAVGVQTK